MLLEVRNLTTHFYTADGVVKAVEDLSFSLERGETLGIVGESGSGKSATALSILNLIPSPPGRILSGEVIFKERDLLKLPEPELRKIRGDRIAMIFQDPMTSLNPVFAVGEQIAEALRIHRGSTKTEAMDKAVDLLDTVGIPHPSDRARDYPHQLSGGMRQRVMIAMALACEPDVLIADEPTTALDVTVQAQILDLMGRLQEEVGSAIILITHDLGIIAEMVDRVIVMYAGKAAEVGSIDEVFYRPRHPYTLGLLDSITRLDEERKEKLRTIRGLPPSLISVPPGCPFNPRCPYAQEICFRVVPPLREIDPGHFSACHFAETLKPRREEVRAT